MANNLPNQLDKVDVLRAELIDSLQQNRDDGCDLDAVTRMSRELIASFAPLIDHDNDSPRGANDAPLELLERAYRSWKKLRHTFEETLEMAYSGDIPRSNLLLDSPLNELNQRLGEPLCSSYTRMRARRRGYLRSHPWNEFMNERPAHIDSEELDGCLTALVRGDDLDVEDALQSVSGDLRHAFVDFIEEHPDDVPEFELNMWKRPEFLVTGDYWRGKSSARVLGALRRNASPRFSQAFSLIESLFSWERVNRRPAAGQIVDTLRSVPFEQRDRLYRCLLLHPDYEIRRYAVNNIDTESIWKVLTVGSLPCATLLTIVERMVGSRRFTVAEKKVFFNAAYRRLLNVATRPDVLYARGIVRGMAKFDFLLEDELFVKFATLLDYLDRKETTLCISDPVMSGYRESLQRAKDRIGAVAMETPDFGGIPLVVLRKLARDGHYWHMLATHPMVKIARETIRHINNPNRATRVASNPKTNTEVLRDIGKRCGLFSTASSRMALLTNPRTPPTVSMRYTADLGSGDIEKLLRHAGVHPELRTLLRNRHSRSVR